MKEWERERERERSDLPKEIIQAFGLIEERDNKEEFLAEEGIWTQGEGEEDILREMMSRRGEKVWALNMPMDLQHVWRRNVVPREIEIEKVEIELGNSRSP